MARSWLLGHPVEFNHPDDGLKQGTIVRTYVGNVINPNAALMLVVQLETGALVTVPAYTVRVLDEPSAK